MIDPQLLQLIRCPIDGQTLSVAPSPVVTALNASINQRQLRDASDGVVEDAIDGALVTADRQRCYPIRGGIPTLIPGEAMPLAEMIQAIFD